MMLKKFLPFLLLAMLVVACAPKTVDVVKLKHEDGTARLIYTYQIQQNDSVLVYEKQFYPNGKLEQEGQYKEDLRDGKWTYYYENGNKWSEGYFKAALSHGKRSIWYENGQLHMQGAYDQGARIGLWKFFRENGELAKEVDYNK